LPPLPPSLQDTRASLAKLNADEVRAEVAAQRAEARRADAARKDAFKNVLTVRKQPVFGFGSLEKSTPASKHFVAAAKKTRAQKRELKLVKAIARKKRAVAALAQKAATASGAQLAAINKQLAAKAAALVTARVARLKALDASIAAQKKAIATLEAQLSHASTVLGKHHSADKVAALKVKLGRAQDALTRAVAKRALLAQANQVHAAQARAAAVVSAANGRLKRMSDTLIARKRKEDKLADAADTATRNSAIAARRNSIAQKALTDARKDLADTRARIAAAHASSKTMAELNVDLHLRDKKLAIAAAEKAAEVAAKVAAHMARLAAGACGWECEAVRVTHLDGCIVSPTRCGSISLRGKDLPDL
jgi:hypothetical protein